MSAARERALLAAALLLLLAPFAGAAFGIDDPVFLAVARRIGAAPLDPFGFQMAWDATSLEVARFNLNPPLWSYWLAPWLALFGERETWLHVAGWPFALLAAFSFHGIARRCGLDALPATALLVASPAFLVLATTLQLDVPVGALLLASVHALLRARDGAGLGAELWAGCAAAAAGLTKYVGLASLPLLAAGLVLLPRRTGRWSAGSWLRVLGPPLLAFVAWGAFSRARYGFVHYAAGVALVGERSLVSAELVNHWLSVPIWYAGALVFPLCFAARALWREKWRVALPALLALAAGAAVALFVLPTGEPLRRVPLANDQALFAALCFAAALGAAALVLARGRALLADPLDRFLALWAGGFAVFTVALNWHVNAADALLVAPPWLLLLLRNPATRPPVRVQWGFVALSLALSLALAQADAAQRNVYRSAAAELAAAIGEAPGARWQVGQWGFQHYVEREGFRPLLPPTRTAPGSPLQPGDWVAAARNVSQLDVAPYMTRFRVRPQQSFAFHSANPLRTTNPDAGAGFYSHHGGYVPFAWSRGPLDEIGLGRVVAVPEP